MIRKMDRSMDKLIDRKISRNTDRYSLAKDAGVYLSMLYNEVYKIYLKTKKIKHSTSMRLSVMFVIDLESISRPREIHQTNCEIQEHLNIL